MMKSDYEIRKLLESEKLIINRPDGGPLKIGPSSVDVHLGDTLEIMEYPSGVDEIDVTDESTYPTYRELNDLILPSKTFVLAHTEEVVGLPDTLVATLWGRSSLARLGISIHDAGLIDAGFYGQVVLEIYNHLDRPIKLAPKMRVGQLTFYEHLMPPFRTYDQVGKYAGQMGVRHSEFYKDFE